MGRETFLLRTPEISAFRFIPKTGGTYFGQSMTANYIYTIAGTGGSGYDGDGVAANTTRIYNPTGVSADLAGNIYLADTKPLVFG
jgi:hypothetical protein